MSPIGRDALLHAGRSVRPTVEAKARVREKILEAIVVPASPASVPSTPAPVVASVPVATKIMIVAAVLATVAATGFSLRAGLERGQAASATMAAPVSDQAMAESPPVEISADPSQIQSPTPPVPPHTAESAPKPATSPRAKRRSVRVVQAPPLAAPDPLTVELEALRHVESLLRTESYASALAELARYRDQHPRGRLEPEAATQRIRALCGLGRVEEAERELQARSDLTPSLRDRIMGSCASDDRPTR